MKGKFPIPALAIVFVFLVLAPALSAEFLVTIAKNVNIRTGPGTGNFIIGRTEKGDLYKYVGEEDDWYKIEMFSGEIRYIGKSVGARLTEQQLLPGHEMAVPESESRRRLIYKDILNARERAKKEAGEIIPEHINQERHENFRAIREDGNILYIMHSYGVQPALYDYFMGEGEHKSW